MLLQLADPTSWPRSDERKDRLHIGRRRRGAHGWRRGIGPNWSTALARFWTLSYASQAIRLAVWSSSSSSSRSSFWIWQRCAGATIAGSFCAAADDCFRLPGARRPRLEHVAARAAVPHAARGDPGWSPARASPTALDTRRRPTNGSGAPDRRRSIRATDRRGLRHPAPGVRHVRRRDAAGRPARGKTEAQANGSALAAGLEMAPLSRHYAGTPPPRGGLLLGFSAFDAGVMASGVAQLASVLRKAYSS